MSADLLSIDVAQTRSSGIWDYVSPSRLNCWIACPLRFRARYIDGIKTPTTPSLFLKKRVHAGLERYYRHRMLGITLELGDVTSRMDETWEGAVAEEEMAFESVANEADLKKQAASLVLAYLRQIPADEPRPAGVEVTMESPLVDPASGEGLGIPLLGVADLLVNGAEGPVIADFKTSSRSAPPFEVTHEVQLSCYSYLYRQLTGQQESGLEIRSLIKTRQPKVEVHRYDSRAEAHFRRLFSVIREYLDALHSGRFNYRPGWGCAMCDFRNGPCRGWTG